MRVLLLALGLLVPGLIAMKPVAAHHSFAAVFDEAQPVTLQGIVTKFEWTNPHVYFLMDVTDEDGQVAEWAFELLATSVLQNLGWTRNSLRAGEFVQVQGELARDGSNFASGRTITILRTGERLVGVGRPGG